MITPSWSSVISMWPRLKRANTPLKSVAACIFSERKPKGWGVVRHSSLPSLASRQTREPFSPAATIFFSHSAHAAAVMADLSGNTRVDQRGVPLRMSHARMLPSAEADMTNSRNSLAMSAFTFSVCPSAVHNVSPVGILYARTAPSAAPPNRILYTAEWALE